MNALQALVSAREHRGKNLPEGAKFARASPGQTAARRRRTGARVSRCDFRPVDLARGRGDAREADGMGGRLERAGDGGV